jgi:hypothetical protein
MVLAGSGASSVRSMRDRVVMPAVALRFTTRLVGVPSVTRTIDVLSTQTLHDLHRALQDAHDWDDDHLYAFWLKGRYWANDGSEYAHPLHAATPGPLDAYALRPRRKSATVQLQRLRLKPGQRIAYVFDFGDEWRIDLRLKTIGAPSEGAYPRIIERGAEAPPQYPDWDEDAA